MQTVERKKKERPLQGNREEGNVSRRRTNKKDSDNLGKEMSALEKK